jgi:putative flippase GtrA
MKSTVKKLWADKRLRFLLIGGLNTIWGIGVYPILYVLLNPLGINYIVILVLAYVASISVSFTSQKIFVFRTKSNHFRELSKFLALQVAILTLNLIALPVVVESTLWNPAIVQVGLSTVIAVISYFFHDLVTFRTKAEKRNGTGQRYKNK